MGLYLCVCTPGAMPLLPVPGSGREREMFRVAVLRQSHTSAAAGTMAGGTLRTPGDVSVRLMRVRHLLVPWVGLFVERGVWAVAVVLKQLRWAGKLPGRGVQRP